MIWYDTMISHQVPWPDLTEPLEPLHGKKVANVQKCPNVLIYYVSWYWISNFQFTFSNCQFDSIHQVVFKRSTPEEFCDGLSRFLDGETHIFCPRVVQEEVFLTMFSHIFSVTWRSRSDRSQSVRPSELADLTDVTLVSDDTFRRHGTWVTHDHLSSVIESVRLS